MPERLATTDPFKQVTEMVGSGPYRYKADERVAGSLVVYERYADYVPRPRARPSGTAGPKVAHFDRVEWHIIPDAGTVAAAMQQGRDRLVAGAGRRPAAAAAARPQARRSRIGDPTGYDRHACASTS